MNAMTDKIIEGETPMVSELLTQLTKERVADFGKQFGLVLKARPVKLRTLTEVMKDTPRYGRVRRTADLLGISPNTIHRALNINETSLLIENAAAYVLMIMELNNRIIAKNKAPTGGGYLSFVPNDKQEAYIVYMEAVNVAFDAMVQFEDYSVYKVNVKDGDDTGGLYAMEKALGVQTRPI